MAEVVFGAYRVVREIGSGGMATVYLAQVCEPRPGLVPGREVALKVLHRQISDEPGFSARFRREVESGTRIRHPNIIETLDCGETAKGHLFLVMEYVEGQSLRELLQDLVRVPEELCRHIGCEVAKALTTIHAAGVIHRDVKPENVLIRRDNAVKLMDFGVACVADARMRLSATGQFVGSIFYAAPEQLQGGGKDLDHRLDLYQLGVLLYELGCGVNPYHAEDQREAVRRLLSEEPRPLLERNPSLSLFYSEAVKALMARDREARPSSAADVTRMLCEGERSAWWATRSEVLRAGRVRVSRLAAPGPSVPFVGREEEIRTLRFLWDRSESGAGQAVLVTGDAGLGKSRLAIEFAERLAQEGVGHLGLCGACLPGEAPHFEDALATALRGRFGGDDPTDALLDHYRGDPLLLPALVARIREGGAGSGEAPLSAEAFAEAAAGLLVSVSREQPVLLLLEDLHRSGLRAAGPLTTLARAIAPGRVLLIATAEPAFGDRATASFLRLSHARRLSLARLTDREERALLRAALGSQRLAETLKARLAGRSDGNPLYVLEFLRSLEAEKYLDRREDGTFVTTRDIRNLRLPAAVVDLALGRIAGIEKADRRILEAAACCGLRFDPEVLAEALGVPVPVLARRLEPLVAPSGVLRAEAGAYRFEDHPLQETLYEGLPDASRRRFHAAIGRVYESRLVAPSGAGAPGPLAVEACRHLLACGEAARALPHLPAAEESLAAAGQVSLAVDLLRRALGVPGAVMGVRRAELLLRRADWLSLSGSRREQRECIEEALGVAAREGEPRLTARGRRALGDLQRRTCDYKAANRTLAGAVQAARAAGDPECEAQALAGLGLVAFREGRVPPAREMVGRAVRMGGGAEFRARCRSDLARFDAAEGRFEEALRVHGEVITEARGAGLERVEARALAGESEALWALGRSLEALLRRNRAIEIERRFGDREAEAESCLFLGLASVHLGHPGRAGEDLEEARAIFRDIACPIGEAAAVRGLALAAELAGRNQEAEKGLSECLARQREVGHRHGVAEALLDVGRRHGLGGRTGVAAEELMEAQTIGREVDWPRAAITAAAWLARLNRAAPALAERLLAESGDRLDAWSRIEVEYLLHLATKSPARLEAAHRFLQEVLGQAPPGARIEMCDVVPLYRDILAAVSG